MTTTQHPLRHVHACPFLPMTASPPSARFTRRARGALDRAPAVACASGRTHVGTEHQLLAMFDVDDAFAVAILSEWGVTRSAVEDELRRVEREPAMEAAATSLAPAARTVREDAERIAAELGHQDIGTEHVLLALYSHEGLAGQILTRLGADHGSVRARIVAVLNPE
jgi:ATP-dependent Clp protease ATP-binding subunit ClpA